MFSRQLYELVLAHQGSGKQKQAKASQSRLSRRKETKFRVLKTSRFLQHCERGEWQYPSPVTTHLIDCIDVSVLHEQSKPQNIPHHPKIKINREAFL